MKNYVSFFLLFLILTQISYSQVANSTILVPSGSSLANNNFNKNSYSNSINTYSIQQISDSISINKIKWHKTDTGKSLIISGSLIGLGLYTYKDSGFLNRIDIKDEINRYLPNFHDPIDDYTQFIPYAAVYALPAFGIESKHNTKRKLTTMATSLGLNLIVIQALKYSVKEERPDGSAKNSFPSGHTATAFMGAHILHKEYSHKSPLYSIGGYVLATITGVYRQLNNKHWVSDVLVGAGLGISLTELAYFFNDKWYGEKGVNEIIPIERQINISKPSFIGLKTGYVSLLETTSDLEPGISSKSGYKFSLEGAYFINKHFGIGGEIGFQSFPSKIDATVEREFNNLGYEIIPQSSGNRLYYLGPYFQLPFGKNAIGSKFLLGAISGTDTEIFLRSNNQLQNTEDVKDISYATYTPSTSFSWSTGIYYNRILNNNLSVSIYVDYNNADNKYDVTYIESFENGEPFYSPIETKISNWDSYSIGGIFNVMLW